MSEKVTRRGVLGFGVAAAVGGLSAGTASAAELGAAVRSLGGSGRPMGETPVTMSLHTHSCFSEGGSYAGGGGGASMVSQLNQASRTGTDVVWWSDHDWRMQAYGYYEGIAFDGTNEGQTLTWTTENNGPITGTQHTFVDEPHSPREPGRAMRVSATGTDPTEWGGGWIWAQTGNSFYSTNITDTTFTVDVLGEQVGPDAEVVIQLETSYRPAVGERPAGVYVLEYRLGAQAFRGLSSPLTGAVTVQATGDWQELRIQPIREIREFWPDLVAEDSGFARIRFGIRARGGATGQGVFDHLRISRSRDRDPQRWAVDEQKDLIRRLGRQYPAVTQLMSTEVSMVRHLNVYMENLVLYPYPDRGVAPSLDNSVEAAENMVDWYHERGALVQYNHPPLDVEQLVATRALGCDLMETADAGGNFDTTNARLNMFDVAARNGIFLTATSQNDDHAGQNWSKQHLFHTSAWTRSKTAKDLIKAMAQGQVYLNHQRLWHTGQLDMAIGGHRAMGRVMKTDAESVPLDIHADNLPEGATVDVILGACDLSGATASSIERHSYPADAFTGGRLGYQFEKGDGRYLRLEVFGADGVLIGISNALWLLPKKAKVKVPAPRKLVIPEIKL